jgi:hypothetical protein
VNLRPLFGYNPRHSVRAGRICLIQDKHRESNGRERTLREA